MQRFHWPRLSIRGLWSYLLCLVLVLAPVVLLLYSQNAGPVLADPVSPELRKAPGQSPKQTIDNLLSLGLFADNEITDAIRLGLAEPGWRYSPAIHRRVDQAQEALQQAIHALDLSDVPHVLRPRTGVAEFLRLYSLLRYDLALHPGLQIPDRNQVRSERLTVWSLPDSPITLYQIPVQPPVLQQRQTICGQCSAGDFLFTPETLAQLPNDFETVFSDHPDRRREFGADLFEFWALLPGGALPPKWFFHLPSAVRHTLVIRVAGQSLLQWLLLVPCTLGAVALLSWWLLRLLGWHRQHRGDEGPSTHLLRAMGFVPALLVIWLWQWFAVDWINLYGLRQTVVVVSTSIITGFLLAASSYLLFEAIGQHISWQSHHHSTSNRRWVRRSGSGQIMTMARIAGLVAALVVVIHTGRELGFTSLTLLALSSVPALAISLGTQQLIHDIADGFSLFLDGQIKPGSSCVIGTPKSGEIKGQVLSLGMRSLRLELEDGSTISIPNSQVASSMVTSMNGPLQSPQIEANR